ncbi:hypothetical protein LJC22_01450 [Desulfosarcina sp. OttesenSCG-928-G10]|nr:hypothetical protein [Desulfosarcina sp. OttesenSCG-928-G10]
MAGDKDGKLAKMVVETYADATYSKKTGHYAVLFNPENYSADWDFTFETKEFVNGGNLPGRLQSISHSNFDMTFIIDGTGVGAAALGRDKINVMDEVWNFLEATTVLSRKSSRKQKPPYCMLVWGSLCARCFVKRVKLEMRLLDRNGTPLRAALITSFQTFYPSSAKTK